MPRQLVFEGHPDVGWLHDHYLFGIPIIPSDLLHEHNARKATWTNLSPKEEIKFCSFHEREKPTVMWMYDFVKEIEEEVREEFLWTFQWHIESWWPSDEKSENVLEASIPYWYVTIKDFEGNIVHKHWSIAFAAGYGDLLVIRGLPTLTNRFVDVPWRERSKRLRRVLDAIQEHQRIRNFRLKRVGIKAPHSCY